MGWKQAVVGEHLFIGAGVIPFPMILRGSLVKTQPEGAGVVGAFDPADSLSRQAGLMGA